MVANSGVFRDFDAEQDGEEALVPVTFKLFGRLWNCRDEVDGVALLDFVADIDSDRPREQAQAMKGIFEKVLDPDEIADFMTDLNDPNKPVRLERLAEVVGWLVEQYTDRPTQQPTPLRPGSSKRARTSRAGQSAKA